ncbi:TAXI family TRAP transporter solute-binding subunit [Desulfopila sp. IMCC35008]|uniref:TAXI family TRAP transporter solute-binding subunit n=1 Tax=Desulfopila sp. IMCC35008 TaxID=2653858 RepID=UPI0013D59F8B|nr:TAXI family TRAP transporter solute-binding subunit [Desulfopila sp. IMCC35008]
MQKLLPFLLTMAMICGFSVASAQDMTFFRIGTGGTGGTYYPIGGLVAHCISNPPGSRPCEEGGSCGVPGLVAIAQSANGSVANINSIKSGVLEAGFSQSDVAYWAYTGTGIFEKKGPVKNLRALANLYPETIHLVARKGAGIKSVKDLKGKRVSLDEPGSGTLVDARLILEAYGLTEKDVKADYIKPNPAIEKIKDNQMDAFFIVAGYPTGAVVELASSVGAELVPINGPEADAMIEKYGFFAKDLIPADTYEGIGETESLSVGAQLVVSADVDAELVYGITKALWNEKSRKLLDKGHAKGKVITKETALDGVGIPLHPGAEKFYKEAGLLK